MNCERVKSILSDYLDGSIAESDLAEVDDHLRSCRPCASEAEGLKDTIELLHALPLVKAPPELLEKVRTEIARGTVGKPLWKKLFLPAHVKIPLEAAAVAALFLLVVATQRDRMPREIPSYPQSGGQAAAPARDGKGIGGAPGGAPGSASAGSARSTVPADGRQPRASRQGEIAPRRETPAEPAHSIPVVPAQRISTDAGKIETGGIAEEKVQEEGFPRFFAASPSRLLHPVPFGRQVTLEVTTENRAGLEERIAAAAMRLGGSFALMTPRAGSPENTAVADPMRVHVPSESAGTFLAELSQLGTLPQEGMSDWADFPAGPYYSGVVAYTVRIRVR